MKRSIVIIAGFLLAAIAPLPPEFALTRVESAPVCIDQTPACVKQIEFVEGKAGCQLPVLGTETIDGSSYRLRGRVEYDRSVIIDGAPVGDGWYYVTVNADADVTTGVGVAWGTFLRLFDDLTATVYGTWTGTLDNWLLTGSANGRATGEYAGYLVEAHLETVPVGELPGGDPCPLGALSDNALVIRNTFRVDPLAQGGRAE